MGRLVKVLLLVLMVFLADEVGAQTQPLIAPNVLLRGIQLPTGVRYTAAMVKPSDDAVLRNVSVEITLPANAMLAEMLISPQVEFDVVRRNRAGQLTLIWQISQVPADRPLDSFSFTVAQPLSDELEFYAAWQNQDQIQYFENFFELPPLVFATQSESQITLTQAGFVAVGNTGVQVAASTVGMSLNVRVLPADFNPPAVYGDLWWCSLLEVVGLPAAMSADVIVPLRRPLAPFTPVALFALQQDGSWLPLDGQGVVTADGQYALYTHPGGVVATGVPIEVQPEIVPADAIVVEQIEEVAPPPVDQPPADSTGQIADGTSNTVNLGEVPPPTPEQPPTENLGQINDGSSNTILLGEGATPTPEQQSGGTTDQTTGDVADVSITREGTVGRPQAIGVVASPTYEATAGGEQTAEAIGDVQITNEGTIGRPPTGAVNANPLPTLAVISASPTAEGAGGVFGNEGTPGQVIVVGGTNAPNVVVTATPTAQGQPTNNLRQIGDGSSNTILIGEGTPGQSPTTDDGSVRPIGQTPTTSAGQIADGSSNTILIGESTPSTPPPTQPSDGNTGQITDGSSNTILLGEATSTPGQPTPFPPPIRPNPFGAGGGRLEIILQDSGTVVQCQFGRVNCVSLRRRLGAGLR